MSEADQNDEAVDISKKDVPQNLYEASKKVASEIRKFNPDVVFFLGKSTLLSKTLLKQADANLLNDFVNATLEDSLNKSLTGNPIGGRSSSEGSEADRAKKFLESLKESHGKIHEVLVKGNKRVALVDDYIAGGTKMANSLEAVELTGNLPMFFALSYITEGAGFDEAYKVSPSTFPGKVFVGNSKIETHDYITKAARLISDSVKDNALKPGTEAHTLLSRLEKHSQT